MVLVFSQLVAIAQELILRLNYHPRPQLLNRLRADAGDSAHVFEAVEGPLGAFIDDALGHFGADAGDRLQFIDFGRVRIDGLIRFRSLQN